MFIETWNQNLFGLIFFFLLGTTKQKPFICKILFKNN